MESVTPLSIYIQIAAYIVPLIGAGIFWLFVKHFDLKEKVSSIASGLEYNSRSDVEMKDYVKQFLTQIQQINDRLTVLESEMKILISDRDR